MGSKLVGLTRQGNTYLVRVVVPKDVRAVIGKRELIESLGTGDAKDAAKLHPAVLAKFKKLIAEARGQVGRPAAKLDTGPAEVALAKWAAIVTGDPAKWIVPDQTSLTTTPAMLAMIAGFQAFAETGDEAVLPDESISPLPPLPEMTRRMLLLGGLLIAPGNPVIAAVGRQAALHLATAYRFLERERLAHSVRAIPLEDIGGVDVTPKPAVAPSIRLSALYEAWKATLKVADKELGRLDHQQRRLVETVGDLPANHITKAMISEHMGLVARFPGRKRSEALNAMPMRELIEQFEAENAKRPEGERHAPLTAFTADEWFSGYRRMFDYAVANDILPANPMAGLKKYVVRGAESTTRRAFTADELATIFDSPVFRGYDAAGPKGSRKLPGETITRDSKWWLPVLALLHGARLTELAAMPVEHVRQTPEGTWYFDLTDRQVKNVTSQRVIPLHPQLIALGFLDYVADLREREQVWLFPDLDHEAKVGPGHGFSKWFGRWTTSIGLTDPEITFHSFRHTWKRRARQSEVKEELHDVLSGHKGATVGRSYGEGADIQPLATAMGLIRFPELTL